MAEIKNAQSENSKQEEKQEKKKKGVIIGVIGIAAAAAVAVPLALKGCAPGERSYTVTFLTDEDVEGFKQGSMNVKEGTTVGKLKDQLAPVDGYDFEGFYKDPDCTDPFDDDEVVSDDTKIYIQYTEIIITVRFHGEVEKGELVDPQIIEISYFDKISDYADKINIPTKDSKEGKEYTFSHWRTKDDAYTSIDFLNKELTGKYLLEVDPDRVLDLYSVFVDKSIEYTLTIPEGIIVMKDGIKLSSTDTVHYNDRLTIMTGEMDYWTINNFEVYGANQEDEIYKVTGDVSIQVEVEHKYLILTLKTDDTYRVDGIKEETIETNIVIPVCHYYGNAITSILSSTFSNMTNLNSIEISENIKSIGNDAFKGCSKLTEVDFKGTVEQWAHISFGNEYSTPCYYSKSLKINGEDLTELSIDVNINGRAFSYLSTLKKVTFGENVKSVGLDGFLGCSKLAEVNYLGTVDQWAKIYFNQRNSNPIYYSHSLNIQGESLTEITLNVNPSSYTFNYLTTIKKVTLGENVTSVGWETFYCCSKLSSVVTLGTIKSLSSNSFGCCALTEINHLIANLTTIPSHAFRENSGLQEITIGENITKIENYAFYGCTKLKLINWNAKSVTNFNNGNYIFKSAGSSSGNLTVIFGDSVKSIPAYCFYPNNISSDRAYIKSIVIGSGVESIGDFAFNNCSSLISMIIGKSVKSIGNYAFRYCSNLQTIYYSGNEDDWSGIKFSNETSDPTNNGGTVYYFSESPNYDGNYWHWEEVNGVQTPTVWIRNDEQD